MHAGRIQQGRGCPACGAGQRGDRVQVGQALPASPPAGSIIAIATEDLGEKKAILAANHPGFFDIAHFDGYPAFLIQLDAADPVVVQEALIDAWLCSAPRNLADTYLERHPPS